MYALNVSLYTDTSHTILKYEVLPINRFVLNYFKKAVLSAKFKEYRFTFQSNKLRIIKLYFISFMFRYTPNTCIFKDQFMFNKILILLKKTEKISLFQMWLIPY